MRNGLRGVAQEISYDLVREIGRHRPMKKSTTGGVIDLLLDQLAEEVVSELTADLKAGTATHDLEARLETLEKNCTSSQAHIAMKTTTRRTGAKAGCPISSTQSPSTRTSNRYSSTSRANRTRGESSW